MKRENNNISLKTPINILKKNSNATKNMNIKSDIKNSISYKEKSQTKKKDKSVFGDEYNTSSLKETDINYSENIEANEERKNDINSFEIDKKKDTRINVNGNIEKIDKEHGNNKFSNDDDTTKENNNIIVSESCNNENFDGNSEMEKWKKSKNKKEERKEERGEGKGRERKRNVDDREELNIKVGLYEKDVENLKGKNYEEINKMEILTKKYEIENEYKTEKEQKNRQDEILVENDINEKKENENEDKNEEENEDKNEKEDTNKEEKKGESEEEKEDEDLVEDESENERENESEDEDDDDEGIKKKKKKKIEDDKSYEKSSIYQSILKKLNLEKNEELEKSHIIIFGNKDVGKSSLIQALQKINFQGDINNEELYQNENCVLPLDYACLNVRNLEENSKIKDIRGNSHIWVLHHSSYISSLVKHIKKFKNIKKIVILMCTDLYKPYNIISDLNHWIESLYILFEELHSDYDLEVFNELKEKLENYIYNYKKQIFEKKNKNKNEAFSIDKKGLIKINLAFPILFIICKSDGYEILNNRTYQGYIDVIISYLRNLAINYQASIIFCNTVNKKEPKNIELLYKYIMHRIYNFPFTENAILDDYEKIFIPSGYDDLELINESIKNTFVENFNKPYDSIIIKPISNKSIVEHSQNIVQEVYFNDFLASITNEITINEIDEQKEGNEERLKSASVFSENSKITEENSQKHLNKEKKDQSLHSFFQSLLAKGRSKSPSAPNITPMSLEKKT